MASSGDNEKAEKVVPASMPAGTGGGEEKNHQAKKASVVPYGQAIPVKSEGKFPHAGSVLGSYFCLGTLGKGTFSSIHMCINLQYHHCDNQDLPRLAAAKVELSNFQNSGVLLSEAVILHFLASQLPQGTVPVYMGHYTSMGPNSNQCAAAIVMEYLAGEDMHQIRDRAGSGKANRRLAVEDAVYLTADVMLPLLQKMHSVGIVHRDVKPSNCVRFHNDRRFALVDFGLSKSTIVPQDSDYADTNHPWGDSDDEWLRPPGNTKKGFYRKERTSADFRGTSMYASLRVHQGKDYSARDDMWSLMYVFCDLVSGGLPWMSHAANRDREACQRLKERVHGDFTMEGVHETEQLLFGDEYHVALFKQAQRQKQYPDSEPLPLPEKLSLCQNPENVRLLQKAFNHLSTLQFWDKPNYELLQSCIRGFLSHTTNNKTIDKVTPIQWKDFEEDPMDEETRKDVKADPTDEETRKDVKEDPMDEETTPSILSPEWDFENWHKEDPLEKKSDIFYVEADSSSTGGDNAALEVMDNDLSIISFSKRSRLPLKYQFYLAQMDYHARNPTTVPPYVVLRDWMKVAIPLTYNEWDAQRNETGGHRTKSDGYKRDFLLEIMEQCLKWSRKFDQFSKPKYFTHQLHSSSSSTDDSKTESEPATKRRKIVSTFSKTGKPTDFIAVSKVLFALRTACEAERKKRNAPPPRLSFGSGRM